MGGRRERREEKEERGKGRGQREEREREERGKGRGQREERGEGEIDQLYNLLYSNTAQRRRVAPQSKLDLSLTTRSYTSTI